MFKEGPELVSCAGFGNHACMSARMCFMVGLRTMIFHCARCWAILSESHATQGAAPQIITSYLQWTRFDYLIISADFQLARIAWRSEFDFCRSLVFGAGARIVCSTSAFLSIVDLSSIARLSAGPIICWNEHNNA